MQEIVSPTEHRSEVLEAHLRRQEGEHAADVRQHAAGEKARDGEPPVEALPGELRVLMVRIVVAGHAAEERDISFGEGPPEREGASDLQCIERFTQLSLESRCCFGHGRWLTG